MNYSYTETDAHGALDAIIADKRVESYRFDSTINDFAWLQVTRQSFIDALEPTRKFRIRHEVKHESVEEVIIAAYNQGAFNSNDSHAKAINAWMLILSALKAEILEEVKK